jgi:hypothetical protein
MCGRDPYEIAADAKCQIAKICGREPYEITADAKCQNPKICGREAYKITADAKCQNPKYVDVSPTRLRPMIFITSTANLEPWPFMEV